MTDKKDNPPNPTGVGGFGDHPENISPGGWKKEDSITYQYNMLLRMPDQEFTEWIKDVFDSGKATQAQKMAYRRIVAATGDNDLISLPSAKEITDRVEGKAPQSIKLDSTVREESPYKKLTDDQLRRLAEKNE